MFMSVDKAHLEMEQPVGSMVVVRQVSVTGMKVLVVEQPISEPALCFPIESQSPVAAVVPVVGLVP
jgi:hypothetical protein